MAQLTIRPLLRLSCLAFACGVASPAEAQTEAPQGSGLHLSAELGVVSQYRFRGISLSGRGPALQGGLAVEHDSGAFAGAWASTLHRGDTGAASELDIYAGYATPITSRVDAEIVLNLYTYPSHPEFNYVEGASTFSFDLGGAQSNLIFAYAPSQDALEGEDNIYVAAGLEVPIAGSPFSLFGQIGYEAGAFDEREGGGKMDWQIGGRIAQGIVTGELAYVDSNARVDGAGGTNIAGSALVASVLLGF